MVCAFWFTPTMTVAHLVFAIATTAYILIAIQLEERDLVHVHGRDYIEYRKRTPMLVPSIGAGGRNNGSVEPERNAACVDGECRAARGHLVPLCSASPSHFTD